MLKFNEAVLEDQFGTLQFVENDGVVVAVVRGYSDTPEWYCVFDLPDGQYGIEDESVPFECGTMTEVTRAMIDHYCGNEIDSLANEIGDGVRKEFARIHGELKVQNARHQLPRVTSPAQLYFSGETERRIAEKVKREFGG